MDESIKKVLEAATNDPLKNTMDELFKNPLQNMMDNITNQISMFDPINLPELRKPDLYIPEIPTHEEIYEYQSARVLMQRLADSITQWRQQLPDDQQPAILALLNGGVRINVERLAEESFHGIRIEGRLQGGNLCMILAHQATVQLFCYIEKVEREETRRRIGFIIGGKEEQV